MTERTLDETVLAAAVSARKLLEEKGLDEYVVRETKKMLLACNEYFVFLGKPEAKFTKEMLRSYESENLSKQMELSVEGSFDGDY